MRMIRNNKPLLYVATLLKSALLMLWMMEDALPTEVMSRKALLGEMLFNDSRLSVPEGQACAGCHSPEAAFTDPHSEYATSQGAIAGRFGVRNTPSIMYGSTTPRLHWSDEDDSWIGGQFRDGRVNTQKEQAQKPVFNVLEMNNADPASLIEKIRTGPYAAQFLAVYGKDAFKDPIKALGMFGDAIQAYERTSIFQPFGSKYDRFLNGLASLTSQEMRGLDIFVREDKGNCAACHPNQPSPTGKQRPLFTDFSYDNIGVPKNADNPFYQLPKDLNPLGNQFIDKGLGQTVKNNKYLGQFKVPTLRNIEKTAPYMHNGYFKTLRGVIEFYNTRDTRPLCRDGWTNDEEALKSGCWPGPEISTTVNRQELGHLRLTNAEIDDLLAFLHTLNDP